jgi:predicted lipoprotein with Yx(FWY)xxD motif
MNSRYMILGALVALSIAVSACSPQATPTAAPAAQASATQASAPAAASGPAMVNLGKSDKLGSFLVDDKGMTLYLFTKDSPGTSTCYDKCATAWPARLTVGNAAAGAGVDASKFGTTTRTDGTTQVTYNGWPLYYYAKDKQAGETTGQGVGSVWYLIAATGDAIK